MTTQPEVSQDPTEQPATYQEDSQDSIDGCVEFILLAAELRGIELTGAQREQISTCTNLDLLLVWVLRMFGANVAEDIFGR